MAATLASLRPSFTRVNNASDCLHLWHRCHGCGAEPIVGRRYSCTSCPIGPDNDLCETCHRDYVAGKLEHPAPRNPHGSLIRATHQFRITKGTPDADLARWQIVPDISVPAPKIENGFVVRPEFCTAGETFFGSHAFAATIDELRGRIVLTALHVLDALIKANGIDASVENANYRGTEIPAIVRRVRLYDVFAPLWPLAELGMAQGMRVIADARTGEEEPYAQRDVAAFDARGCAALAPRRLATRIPAVGEPVWLACRAATTTAPTAFTAVVVESTSRSLIFRYAPGVPVLHGSSGAPILNRLGEIVGINVGGGAREGRRYGHACHAVSIRRILARPVTPLAAADATGCGL